MPDELQMIVRRAEREAVAAMIARLMLNNPHSFCDFDRLFRIKVIRSCIIGYRFTRHHD